MKKILVLSILLLSVEGFAEEPSHGRVWSTESGLRALSKDGLMGLGQFAEDAFAVGDLHGPGDSMWVDDKESGASYQLVVPSSTEKVLAENFNITGRKCSQNQMNLGGLGNAEARFGVVIKDGKGRMMGGVSRCMD